MKSDLNFKSKLLKDVVNFNKNRLKNKFINHSVDEITNDLQIYTRRNGYHFDLNLLEKFHLQTELNI